MGNHLICCVFWAVGKTRCHSREIWAVGEKHAVGGTEYVVLTDHVDQAYLESLQKLTAHHKGQIVRVPDLALLHEQEERFNKLQKQLRTIGPKYAAIAPRLDSFRENMLMGMWELFSTLDLSLIHI